MVKERPILFSGAMVRAILDGRKTQTRRVMKHQPQPTPLESGDDEPGLWIPWNAGRTMVRNEEMVWACPYGGPESRLWVRETWKPSISHSHGMDACDCEDLWVEYPAGGEGKYFEGWRTGADWTMPQAAIRGQNVPSLFMPRWASRITLEVTGVRVERLNDCSEADARAEGVRAWSTSGGDGYEDDGQTAREQFADLWNSINGAGAWGANPWVWVVEFRRIEP